AAFRELDETLDTLDHGVWRAHEGGAGLDTVPDGIVRAAGRPAQCLLEVRHGFVALPRVYLTQGELVVIGHVAVDDEPPLAAIHVGAVLGRRLLADAPVLRAGLGPAWQPRPQGENAEPVLARADHARGGHHARHRDGEAGIGVGRKVQARVAELEPVRLH